MISEEEIEEETVDELPPIHHHTRRRSSMHVEDDYLDGSKQLTIENYLKGRRRSSVRRVSSTGMDEFKNLRGGTISEKRRPSVNASMLYSSEPLWEKLLAEPEVPIPVNWRYNPIDKNSLYAVKKENIAGRDLPFLPHPKLCKRKDGVANNVEQNVEHEYIAMSHLSDNSQAKFNNAVIQRFFRAPAPRTHPGYGMPRPETAEENPFRLLMADLERDPSIVPISSYPLLTVPSKCSENREFCEILGNSSCAVCIEKTNRFIGDELQRIMFPQIEMTKHKLVQPKLAKVMREGHLKHQRRRRMKELGYCFDMSFIRRQETNLFTTKKVQILPISAERGARKDSFKQSSQSRSSRTTHLTTLHEERLPSQEILSSTHS